METKTSYFEPLYDRILVRRLEEKKETGGVIIPDANKEAPLQGVVLQVGLGKRNDAGEFTAAGALIVKSGDHVLFGKYAGTEIKLDGEDLLVMREEEVLGITKRAGDIEYRLPLPFQRPSADAINQVNEWATGHTRGEM